MTTTATEPAGAPPCPKCGGGMWNQKYGKFPWKPGTPIFKCKDKECASAGGVIWEPKGVTTKPPAPKPVAQGRSLGEPAFLAGAEQEDNAALASKIGVDLTSIQKDLAVYQAQTEFVLREIAPLYEKAGIGMSPESAAACVQTLFINSTGGKK